MKSENGRSYPWGGSLKHKIGTYEGRVVNCDHGKTSSVDRRFGWLANERTGDDGRPRADLHVLRSHPMAERVFEAAERNPSLFGMSHVVIARTRMESGVEVIEEIESAESVDIVASPATTKGLFESIQPMKRKLLVFLEGVSPKLSAGKRATVTKWLGSKRLQEADDAYGDGMADMPAAEEVGTGDGDVAAGITDAFRAAINSIVDAALAGSSDPKEALTKIKKMLVAHGDINGDGKVDAADVDAVDDEPADVPAMESVGAKHVLGVMDTLKKSGLTVCRETIEAVGYIPADKRDAAIKSISEGAAKPGERPRTTGRDDGRRLTESANAKAAADKELDFDTLKFG